MQSLIANIHSLLSTIFRIEDHTYYYYLLSNTIHIGRNFISIDIDVDVAIASQRTT